MEYQLELIDVAKQYKDFLAVDRVNMQIKKGEIVSFLGASGCGKTTTLRMIAGLIEPTRGTIKIEGKAMNGIPPYKRDISMVFQNVYLFHDTVRNNIRFGKPDASDEEIIMAAKAARCHEFIQALSDGYDTVIGEGGDTLSGGEKQRISIARAILKDAPVIILDEATASIDPENEHLIQGAITELTRGKTVISIAHRLATIENADQILVLDEGRIVGIGRHEELIENCPVYREIARSQMKGGGEVG